MPQFTITWTPSARRQLEKLPPDVQRLVATAVDMLSVNPRPPSSARLRNSPNLRVRVRDYRIIYEINDRVLIVKVIRVGHRREVYRP
ncbi:MAG: type II toxin-antitoxin system RelE/ParE family toxin [Actinobacteria bacterium]|jgi:mRNA interferase RelE/StbE|nr:type II toxin-antitoxin system RelE/ParE family toxin [Actinomycetota bacterium]NBR65985.1 type II toxin-antitoxin system RelE/ParE family toxin [Actinomycetota bacterium]NBU15918.1 type II toxin-antitoxin system RelE/ParE family toxin [Actinomycetota bacterium]